MYQQVRIATVLKHKRPLGVTKAKDCMRRCDRMSGEFSISPLYSNFYSSDKC